MHVNSARSCLTSLQSGHLLADQMTHQTNGLACTTVQLKTVVMGILSALRIGSVAYKARHPLMRHFELVIQPVHQKWRILQQRSVKELCLPVEWQRMPVDTSLSNCLLYILGQTQVIRVLNALVPLIDLSGGIEAVWLTLQLQLKCSAALLL